LYPPALYPPVRVPAEWLEDESKVSRPARWLSLYSFENGAAPALLFPLATLALLSTAEASLSARHSFSASKMTDTIAR